MKSFAYTSILALLLAPHSVEAKCAFHTPCRSVKVKVLACTIDDSLSRRRAEWLDELRTMESPSNAEKWRADQIDRLQRFPHAYSVIARIDRTKAEHCEANRPFELADMDVIYWIAAMREELVDSLGGERKFTYFGKTADDCPQLVKASEFRISMSQSWCEVGNDFPSKATNIDYATIDSDVETSPPAK